MSSETLFLLPAFVVFSLVLLGVRRRREGIRHGLRRVILVELTYLIVGFLLLAVGQSPVVAILAGIVCALLVDRRAPARSRYIPRSERRKAVARWELRTGRKFNPRLYHVDHVVPFAKGGSSTADNLEVMERRKNLSKGAKSPWWDLLGR
jgi:Flp pilus assembly protein TadB